MTLNLINIQNIDVLNGIAWDEEKHRLFGEYFAFEVHCFPPLIHVAN
jgi:glutamine cyclotransferase